MYNYAEERSKLFTEEGADTLLKIRDSVRAKLQVAGAVMADYVFTDGDAWTMLAALDYLVDREEIRELTTAGSVPGQCRVFVGGK
uniref:Uncharacterized protein n=1 Tax=viral metagenome TaxID=1070528 RepID=A0A6M3KVD8_9ZZZZ